MRRAMVILLLAAGCGSSAPKGMIHVDLLEPRVQGRSIGTTGQHFYKVRIHNLSDQQVAVESIRLELAGVSDLELNQDNLTFTDVLEPGGTADFDMFVTITQGRGGQMNLQYIDYLEVTVACRADGGPFVDSDVHHIIPENN